MGHNVPHVGLVYDLKNEIMNKEELIKATQILQKHIPNRFPLKNSYIDAMEEYALWYHEELSKLSQHDVSGEVCDHPYEYLSFGEDCYCECEKCNTRLS
jgi:hypothetical protein